MRIIDWSSDVCSSDLPTSKLTQLHLDLTPDMDPDTATGQIAYDKGATFLRTIDQAVGREKWDAYLKAYFDRHAFQPQTSAGFLADLRANLFKNDAATAQKIGLDPWVYQRSEEHTSELQSLMSISYAVFCLKKKTNRHTNIPHTTT